jgi:hypothetical protein
MGLKEDVIECIDAWRDVLRKFGADRPIMETEKLSIARMIQQHGKEFVILSLLGAKYEPASEGFNPARFLSLKRIFDPTKFERFVTLGSRAKNQLEEKHRPVVVEEPEDDKGAPPPAEVLDFIRGMGRGIK